MPVRKIPKNHLCVTGSFASKKNGQMGKFESLLEKEYMLLLDFDERVAGFEEQPVTVPVPGVPRGYTPDLLVHFNPDQSTGRARPCLLTEVKHSSDLTKNAEKYAPKFRAAEQFAADRGWEFGITTEREIRTPRLANLKFLREYRNIVPADSEFDRIIHMIITDGGTTRLSTLLPRLGTDEIGLLPVIWNMVLSRRLIADLDVAIDTSTSLRLA